MLNVIPWEEAKQRGDESDPRGYSKVFIDESCGADKLRMHISVIKPGMRAHDAHQHDSEEICFVLDGEAEVTIEDQTFIVKPNTAVFFAPGKRHGIRNAGDRILKYMIIIGS